MTRNRLLRLLFVLAVGLALPLLRVAWAIKHQVVSFDQVATLNYDQAMAEINQHGSVMRVRFDNEDADPIGLGIRPGDELGTGPRFRCLGPERGAIYAGHRGTWFILGRFKVLENVNGQWRELGIVENQRYVYHPGRKD